NRCGSDVIVVRSTTERPVICIIGASVSVRRMTHIDATDRGPRFAIHACNRCDVSHVFMAIVSHIIRRDYDLRVGLTDAIDDRGVADVVVVGGGGEEPVVARIRVGVGVGRVAHVHGAHDGPRLAVYTGDRRHGRRVRIAVVSGGGARIRRDYYCRVSLGDVVGDYGVTDVVVVAGAVTERPVVSVISAGVGVGRMTQIETAQALGLR